MVQRITVQQLKAWREQGEIFLLIDVREEDEVAICKLDRDQHVPLKKVLQAPDVFPKDIPLVFYCHHGARSLVAATVVAGEKYEKIYNLEGGIDAWAKEIDPTMPKY